MAKRVPVNVETFDVWSMGTTGEAGNITATLTRYPDASSSTAASETVTVSEVGSTGDYRPVFTPVNAHYYKLRLVHSGTYREITYDYDVQAGPSEDYYTEAYCAESDVVAYAQMGDYTSSTVPTTAQVTAFASMRAATVYARLGNLMGDVPPGPSGYSLTIDETTDAGKALAKATREVNAIGAAIDALQAAKVSTTEASERIALLNGLWEQKLEGLTGPSKQYQEHQDLTETHISSGQSEEPDVTSYEQGLDIGVDIKF